MQTHDGNVRPAGPAGQRNDEAAAAAAAAREIGEAIAGAMRSAEAAAREIGEGIGATLARLEDVVIDEWGEGCTLSDVVNVTAAPPDERNPALERLSTALATRWHVYGADAREALAERAAQAGGWAAAKRAAAATGLLLAAADAHRPQHVRFGERWVVGEDGRKALVRPLEGLAVELSIRWLRARALGAAAAVLVDAPWPPPPRLAGGREADVVPIERAVQLADVAGPGLLSLVDEADEAHGADEDPAEAWAAHYERATPAQRRILDEMLAAVREGRAVAEARAVAAERLGIAPGTVRAQLHKLRHPPPA